jgi:hypothetical protein
VGPTYREFSVDIIKLNSNFNPYFLGLEIGVCVEILMESMVKLVIINVIWLV